MPEAFDFAQDMENLYPRLWRFCLATTGARHAADDLAQASCLKAIEKIHQFAEGTAFDAWVFRIAKNTWINELRANTVRRGGGLVPTEEFELADTKSGPESNLSGAEALEAVMALPEAQRTTTFLVYVEGYSYKETADMLDIPIGTVMSRLAASRKKLAQALSADAPEATARDQG